MNIGLVILGVLIIGAMFFFSNILITPQQKSQIKIASSLCNSPLGSIGGAISSDVATNCQQIGFLGTIIGYETFIYLAGIVLLVIGVAIPSSKKEVHVIKEVEKPKEETEDELYFEKTETKGKKSNEYKFCSKCGAKISKKSKFCTKCGEKA